jgi:hypothetical protein
MKVSSDLGLVENRRRSPLEKNQRPRLNSEMKEEDEEDDRRWATCRGPSIEKQKGKNK